MTIENNGQHTVIRASEGMFLANASMTLYGTEIILGIYDIPENYTELPMEQWPEEPELVIPEPGGNEPSIPSKPVSDGQEPHEPSDNGDEVGNEVYIPNPLEAARASKLREISAYDNSPHVNGFHFGETFMWLDRETRASLRNTIESASIVGRTELDIWFGDVYITLPLSDARMMLAVLEMYATDCYNVTSQHKVQVRALETVEAVEAFDVTAGYPQMPEFGNNE